MNRKNFFSILTCYVYPNLLTLSEPQDYIHRVGRTARAGRSGVAISLVNQYELEWYIQIEKLIGNGCLLVCVMKTSKGECSRDLTKLFMFQAKNYLNFLRKRRKSCY